jgi:alkylation response protein AidB-like acyl-CoA dehydrogenase
MAKHYPATITCYYRSKPGLMSTPALFSAIIDHETTHLLRNLAADAERLAQLHPDQLAIVYREKWFKLFVPAVYGGLECSLPQALRTEEALAWVDGSLGWTVTLCSGANWFVGFIAPGMAATVFSHPKVCLAGSGRPSGTAKRNRQGYEITGNWHYATGAPHATQLTASCIIEENGQVLKDEAGEPVVRAFWFNPEEVTLHTTWHSTGMIATASNSFSVQALQVPEHRCFYIHPDHSHLQHAVYHYPFLQFAEATLAVNFSGMAMRFLELGRPIITGKKSDPRFKAGVIDTILEKVAKHEQALQLARQSFYEAIEQSWRQMIHTKTVDAALLQQISHTSRGLALLARQLTDDLYPYCGLTAADPHTEINRVWRNLHTATQHSLLTFPV